MPKQKKSEPKRYVGQLRPTPKGAALKATKCVECEAEIAKLDAEARRTDDEHARGALMRRKAVLLSQRNLSKEATARGEWVCVPHKDPDGFTEKIRLAQQEARARCASDYAGAEPKQEELF